MTRSSSGISTIGCFQPLYGGTNDGFLTKFDSAGTLQWGTYFDDGIYAQGLGVTCDNSGNIYLCGGTQSTTNIATSDAYQITLASVANAYLVKFNNAGQVIWGTYFGITTGSNSAVSCVCDKDNNVYIAGNVRNTGIVTTSGCHQDSINGIYNCYLAKFDSNCHLVWSTYYGGDSTAYTGNITCDDSLNVYLAGYTNSQTGISTLGSHQYTYGGYYLDGFLSKFSSSGVLQWGTYYGGSGGEECLSVVYDGIGTIYVGGQTTSDNNIATGVSYQSTRRGAADAFIAGFKTSGGLIWGTYFGGSLNDYGTALATDGNGIIYLSGYTSSVDGIATSGAYQDSYLDRLDAYLVKFYNHTESVSSLNEGASSLSLYPNPNNGSFTLRSVDKSSVSEIDVFNIAGMKVYAQQILPNNVQSSLDISLADSTPGTYFLVVYTAGMKRVISFVVK